MRGDTHNGMALYWDTGNCWFSHTPTHAGRQLRTKVATKRSKTKHTFLASVLGTRYRVSLLGLDKVRFEIFGLPLVVVSGRACSGVSAPT